MNEVHYITAEGLTKLELELEALKEKRKATTLRIEEAIKMGDLSENAEYTDAKEEQAFVEGRIAEIETILKSSEVIKKKRNTGVIGVGSKITIKHGRSEQTFTIVGSEESDPAAGLISLESPLGKAFLGHEKDDKVSVETPRGKVVYNVIDVA